MATTIRATTRRMTRSSQIAQLQRQATQLGDDIADMTQTLGRLADRDGWQHPQVTLLEQDIQRFEAQRRELFEQLRLARSGGTAA